MKGWFIMSQIHDSVDSILSMLDRHNLTQLDIVQALSDLEAMKCNIKEYTYKNTKALLEAYLKDLRG